MRRSACRRMRSAKPARTGDSPSTAGTCSPNAISTGLRDRARRNADLFDGYRVDHLVGFYRTYFRPHDGGDGPVHAAESEDAQRALGERVLARVSASRAPKSSPRISASCRISSAHRSRGSSIAGYKVFRWERHWHVDGSAVQGSQRLSGGVRGDVRHARYRADGDLVGGRAEHREGKPCWPSRPFAIC